MLETAARQEREFDWARFETIFENKMAQIAAGEDPAHDLLHFKRVVRTAKALCQAEGGRLEVVVPAAWLHDFVIIRKDDPRRKLASQIAATAAVEFLMEIQYPAIYLADIAHAIAAHSFSANIEPQTLEAKIVQDADRLDGLGAIGIARCFATAGLLKRAFYLEADPFCELRTPDDRLATVDHFYSKLFITADSLRTEAGRLEGRARVSIMKQYLADLKSEI